MTTVINSNLKKMREENISQKFLDFINNNKKKIIQEDQTVINIVLHKRIDLLPPKFGIWNFSKKEKVLRHNYYRNKKLGIQTYSDDDIIKGWRQSSILHFVSKKSHGKNFKLIKLYSFHANINLLLLKGQEKIFHKNFENSYIQRLLKNNNSIFYDIKISYAFHRIIIYNTCIN